MAKRVRSEAQWQSAVEQQIREAMARGEFDNLPGKGKPIPGIDGHATRRRGDGASLAGTS